MTVEYIVSLENLFSVNVEPVIGILGEIDIEATDEQVYKMSPAVIRGVLYRMLDAEIQVQIQEADMGEY